MNSRMEENSSQLSNIDAKNNLHLQLRNSEDASLMRQIQLNYNTQNVQNRQNRVQSLNEPPSISPQSNANNSNKTKKVFIYTGAESQSDSRPNGTASPINNQILMSLNREQQYTSPVLQARSTTAKGILKLNKQTPLSNTSMFINNVEANPRDKDISLSFTSADEVARRQTFMNMKGDQNNNSFQTKGGDSIQLLPLDQRKASLYSKQRNNNLNTSLLQTQNNTFTNLRKQQSISSNEGAYSDQTHNKPSVYRKNSSNLLTKMQNGQGNEYSSVFLNSKQKLNQSVDFSTTSNAAFSDINTTITQQRTPFMSPDTFNSSPLLDKVKNAQFPNKDHSTHSFTEQTPFRATNQKFRISSNGSFSEYQNPSNLQNLSSDNVYEDVKMSDQKENKSSKFLHSSSYLRKRIQSIDNQKPHGSLPHINEDVNEENAPHSFKESNLTTEEVNRKKQMLLERLKKGSTPNKFHYDEHYDNQKLEDKLYDPTSISIHHPSRNLYDHKNPLRAYQVRSNIPLANMRIVTDPSTYTHQLYYKANQKRQKDQERVISLLEEQDKIMNRIITKYQKRAVQEESQLKMKLHELEKDRDSLVKLKEQEHMLGMMHLNLSQKVDHFKNNMNFYNNQMNPNMPQLRPNMENAFTDMQDLAFLDSILKQAQIKDQKGKPHTRSSSKSRNKSLITCNYNNKII